VIILTVIQILALNADNATSNDTQTAALAQMKNTFEEVNRARCFNHTLQLSAKTLLKPFNAGMSLTTSVFEEEFDHLDDETPLDNDVEGDNEGDSDGDEHDAGEGEPEDADSDEIDELSQLDEQEREKILMDTAVVRRTVTKVRFDLS
jgi:hypothetical protein